MSHTCIHTHAHKLSYPHCYCHSLPAHSLTHTFTHTHFFWMIKSEESDHTIMWEMCFSDIIEMGKKRFLKQQYQKAKFSISLIKFFFLFIRSHGCKKEMSGWWRLRQKSSNISFDTLARNDNYVGISGSSMSPAKKAVGLRVVFLVVFNYKKSSLKCYSIIMLKKTTNTSNEQSTSTNNLEGTLTLLTQQPWVRISMILNF